MRQATVLIAIAFVSLSSPPQASSADHWAGGGLTCMLTRVFITRTGWGPPCCLPAAAGRWSKLKASNKCVPLEDGSACVVLRPIPADNSCLFNSIGYGECQDVQLCTLALV